MLSPTPAIAKRTSCHATDLIADLGALGFVGLGTRLGLNSLKSDLDSDLDSGLGDRLLIERTFESLYA
jgi:hypothetical protein